MDKKEINYIKMNKKKLAEIDQNLDINLNPTLKYLEEREKSHPIETFNKFLSDDDIEYNLFIEGPTFTNSQMGGHPFLDADIYNAVKSGEMQLKDGQLQMTIPFDPYKYVPQPAFDKFWEENNKDGFIIFEGEGITETLYKSLDGWEMLSKAPLKEIIEANDGTSDEDKQKLLKS